MSFFKKLNFKNYFLYRKNNFYKIQRVYKYLIYYIINMKEIKFNKGMLVLLITLTIIFSINLATDINKNKYIYELEQVNLNLIEENNNLQFQLDNITNELQEVKDVGNAKEWYSYYLGKTEIYLYYWEGYDIISYNNYLNDIIKYKNSAFKLLDLYEKYNYSQEYEDIIYDNLDYTLEQINIINYYNENN